MIIEKYKYSDLTSNITEWTMYDSSKCLYGWFSGGYTYTP